VKVEPELPERWSDAERWAWGEIRAGRIADFHARYENLDPEKAEGWADAQKDRRVSPEFLVAILTEERFRQVTPFKGVQISGALFRHSTPNLLGVFEAEIDLRHAQLERQLVLDSCRFQGLLNLMDLHSNSWLSFEGSWFGGAIILNGCVLESHVFLRNVRVGAKVDLTAAKIGGTLDMTGSIFDGPVVMSGIEIGDDLFMRKAPTYKSPTFKDVNLTGAKIGGDLDMTAGTFDGRLVMDGTRIGRSLYMTLAKLPSDKEVSLVFANIGYALDLSGAIVGAIDLTASTAGELRLGSTLGHETHWVEPSRMILRNTTVDALEDAVEDGMDSWPKTLELKGFAYRRLGGSGVQGSTDFAQRRSKWLTDWLKRSLTFSPQPYEQLANWLREAGYPAKANAILYASRKRSRAESLRQRQWSRWIGMLLLESTIGYGLGGRYFRVLWWLAAITAIGFVVLLVSIDKSDWDLMRMAWASFDQAFPIVELNKEHQELILGHCSNWAITYFYVQKLIGYVLGGFLVAGLAGLTQRS
jgi:hypothetical protein